MQKGCQEKRPACVTVIGGVWIAIGGLMCRRAIETWYMRPAFVPVWSVDFLIEVLILVSFFGVGVAGTISAIFFIMRRSWARTVLECLKWIYLLSVLGVFVLFAFEVKDLGFSEAWKPAAVLTCISGAFIAILCYLRGKVVREAMEKRERVCPAFLKKVKKAGVISLIILAGVAAATLFLFLSGRSPEPDASDLRIERVEAPPEENAFTYFEKAREVFDVPDQYGYGNIFRDYLEGEQEGEEERVREVIENNALTIEFIRKALQRDRCIVPEIT